MSTKLVYSRHHKIKERVTIRTCGPFSNMRVWDLHLKGELLKKAPASFWRCRSRCQASVKIVLGCVLNCNRDKIAISIGYNIKNSNWDLTCNILLTEIFYFLSYKPTRNKPQLKAHCVTFWLYCLQMSSGMRRSVFLQWVIIEWSEIRT